MTVQDSVTDTAAHRLAIVGATIIDGAGGPALPDGAIVIDQGQIVAVGPAGRTPIPPGTTVLQAAGQTVVPGIIESHVHVEDDIPGVLRAFLADGVTAVGNTGSSPGAVRAFHEAGAAPDAARGFIAGPAITAIGGYPANRGGGSGALQVTDADDARAAVDRLRDLGVDYVKLALEPFDFNYRSPGVLPVPTEEMIVAAVVRAKEHGLLVRAHIHHATLLDVALDAGVDTVEHMLFALPPNAGYVDLYRAGELRLAALPGLRPRIDRMVRQGIYLVPTIGNELRNIRHGLPELSGDALLAIEELMVLVLAEYVAAGGQVALGSDWVGIPGVPPGMPRGELDYLQRAGMSPARIIETATRHAAEVCAQGHRLGMLLPGRCADLLVLDGDPLRDLGAFQAVRTVVKDGRITNSAQAL